MPQRGQEGKGMSTPRSDGPGVIHRRTHCHLPAQQGRGHKNANF